MAAPEAANNAGAQTSFIPMLTLGIPANPVMALMIGAMIIQGITPGPNVAIDEPALFWGLIVSMWVGNLLLVVLNLPLIGLWVRMLSIPYYVLFPAILTFSAIGVYSINNNAFDLFAVAVFGLLGYVLVKFECEPAPLLLGFVLGPMLEEHLRRAMIIARGDPLDSPAAADQRRPAGARGPRLGDRADAERGEKARRGVPRGGVRGRDSVGCSQDPTRFSSSLTSGPGLGCVKTRFREGVGFAVRKGFDTADLKDAKALLDELA